MVSQFPDEDQAVRTASGVPPGQAQYVETAEVERGVFLSGTGPTREAALEDLHGQLADEFRA